MRNRPPLAIGSLSASQTSLWSKEALPDPKSGRRNGDIRKTDFVRANSILDSKRPSHSVPRRAGISSLHKTRRRPSEKRNSLQPLPLFAA